MLLLKNKKTLLAVEISVSLCSNKPFQFPSRLLCAASGAPVPLDRPADKKRTRGFLNCSSMGVGALDIRLRMCNSVLYHMSSPLHENIRIALFHFVIEFGMSSCAMALPLCWVPLIGVLHSVFDFLIHFYETGARQVPYSNYFSSFFFQPCAGSSLISRGSLGRERSPSP